jgi:hypothetical protein
MISSFTEKPKSVQQKLRELEKFPVAFAKSTLFRAKNQVPGALFAISANHLVATAKFNYRSPLPGDMFVLSIERKH